MGEGLLWLACGATSLAVPAVQVDWLRDDVLCVLPDKMAESPFAADHASRLVFERLASPVVSDSPLDLYASLTRSEGAVQSA